MVVDFAAETEFFRGQKIQWGFDQYVFSAQANDLNHDRDADEVDGSGFGTDYRNEQPGVKKGRIKLKGSASMGKGKVSDIMNQVHGRQSPVNFWYATEGLNALSPLIMQPSSLLKHSYSGKLKDPVEFDAEWSSRGSSNQGLILISPKALLTGTTGTGNEDDNTDFGGATTFGGVGQLHVLSFGGGTSPSLSVKIQHSADDGDTWTDLLTFDAVTSLGSQRKKIPSTTTVNGQVKASWTATGSPTEVQVLLGFARGIDPDA